MSTASCFAPGTKEEDEAQRTYVPASVDSLCNILAINPLDYYRRCIVPNAHSRAALETCNQGDAIWHIGRALRLSGSRAALPLGWAYPYGTKTNKERWGRTLADAISAFVWPEEVEGPFLAWGHAHEPIAQSVAEELAPTLFPEADPTRRITFEYPGGIVIRELPWFVASVDGLIFVPRLPDAEHTQPWVEPVLLEIKCPVSCFYREKYGSDIPPAYLAQIQSYMGFLRLHDPARFGDMRRCVFLQWMPREVLINVYPFAEDFFTQTMLPRLKSFYFDYLLPRFALKDAGLLKTGQLGLIRPLSSLKRTLPPPQTTAQNGRDSSAPAAKRAPAGRCNEGFAPTQHQGPTVAEQGKNNEDDGYTLMF